jgi:hypothetical protein
MSKTKIFISYSHKDESYRRELEKHLSILKRNGDIDTWNDREIIAGENWEGKISEELLNAKIILLLISPDFLASNYCYDIEMKTAIERHNKKEAIVVPIILRHCDWSDTPFSSIQGLPINATPIKEWNDQDKALLNVVEGIKVLLKSANNPDFVPVIIEENELSRIRKKVISAQTLRELREAEFEFYKYKKLFPLTFEVSEFETWIKECIRRETTEKEYFNCYEFECNEKRISCPKQRRGCLKYFLVALFVVIITIFIYFFVL